MTPPPLLNRADLPEIRRKLGLTVAQMAERIGIGAPHMAGLESGENILSPLVTNAIRWVEHVGGKHPGDVCAACEGRGTVRPPKPEGSRSIPARIACAACDGQGVDRIVVTLDA